MKLRPSTVEYFTDGGLRNAVDDLTTNARYHSKGMGWEEYPDLVHAWLGAQRVVADYALSLNDCWQAIWGRCDLSGFATLDFDHVFDSDDAWYDPQSIWQQDWLGRYLAPSRSTQVWFGVGFEQGNLLLGVFLARNGKPVKLPLDDFEYDREWITYVSQTSANISTDGSLSLDGLRLIAERALLQIRAAI